MEKQEIVVCRAGNIGQDDEVPNIVIRTDSEATCYQGEEVRSQEGIRIADALFDSLPGATICSMLSHLHQRYARLQPDMMPEVFRK